MAVHLIIPVLLRQVVAVTVRFWWRRWLTTLAVVSDLRKRSLVS